MATNFPTSLDSYTTKVDGAGNKIFAAHINDPQSAIEALEAKVGIDGSAVTTSLDYLIANKVVKNDQINTITANSSSALLILNQQGTGDLLNLQLAGISKAWFENTGRLVIRTTGSIDGLHIEDSALPNNYLFIRKDVGGLGFMGASNQTEQLRFGGSTGFAFKSGSTNLLLIQNGKVQSDVAFNSNIGFRNEGVARTHLFNTQSLPVVLGASSSSVTGTVIDVAQDIAMRSTVFIKPSLTATITASITQTQGNGALTSEINEVSVVANVNDTVTLPAAEAGKRCIIMNNGVNTLQIFPASGDDLGAGLDTATTLAAGSNVTYMAYDATNWEAV